MSEGLGDGDAGRWPDDRGELLEVEDWVIVCGELIYDAEALRRVMAAEGA